MASEFSHASWASARPEPTASRRLAGGMRVRRGASRVLLIVLAVLALAIVALRMAAPALIRRSVVHALSTRCPSCEVQLNEVRLAVFAGTVGLRGLRVGTRGSHAPALDLGQLDATLELRSLLGATPHVRELRLRDATLVLPEHMHSGGERHGLSDLPRLRVDRVVLDDATLRIVGASTRDRRMTIRVQHAETGALATRAGLGADRIAVRARGSMSGGGDLHGAMRMRPFESGAYADLALRLRGEDLRGLNSFLRPREGVTVGGQLEHARAVLRLRGDRLRGVLSGAYRDLDVDFHEGAHRSGPRAALENAAEDLVLDNTDTTSDAGATQRVLIDETRSRDENHVDFVLHSIAHAAKRAIQH